MKRQQANKYTYRGTTFASEYEISLAKFFDEHGLPWEYEPIRIPWTPAVRYYKPDFRVTMPDGKKVLLEAKGFFDQSARSKMAQVRKQHPDEDIWFVFMRGSNRLSKRADSLTYTEWATKNGFPVLEMPKLQEDLLRNANKRKSRTRSGDVARNKKRTSPSDEKVPGTPELGTQPERNPGGIQGIRSRGIPSTVRKKSGKGLA